MLKTKLPIFSSGFPNVPQPDQLNTDIPTIALLFFLLMVKTGFGLSSLFLPISGDVLRNSTITRQQFPQQAQTSIYEAPAV